MPLWLEKLLWMIVPLLFTAVGSLWNTVGQLQSQVQELNSKMTLVVTKENKVIPSIDAELAREKLRQDVLEYSGVNRERITVLEEKIRHLESKQK